MYKNLRTESLGISGHDCELIELALSFGFRGLDLDISEFAQRVRARGLAHARRLTDSAKLKLSTFALPVNLDDVEGTYQRDLSRLPELVELAATVGCTRARVAIEPASDTRPYHDNFEVHRRRLSELANLLKSHDVRLGVEFFGQAGRRAGRPFEFIHQLDAVVVLVNTVRADNLGIVVDLWQLFASSGRVDDIRKLAPRQIVTVDLADAPAGRPHEAVADSDRLLPGEGGAIDSAAALVTLAELGYDGPVTPCAHPQRFRGMSREKIVRATSEALGTAWKTAGLSASGKLSARA